MLNSRPGAVLFRLSVALLVFQTFSGAAPSTETTPASTSASSDIKLQRVPPMAPAQELANTEVAPGFRLDLVAAEPEICSPVAIAFDEAARMYVVEMIDYSEKENERLGRIRLLADNDRDGRYESSSVFVDDLSWPTAVTCYDGGIFIGDAPDILYCKDTNGDGKADIRKVVYTGFRRSNVQGLLNTFLWGLDHKIYGQTSSSGGNITQPGRSTPAIELQNRDFCFDPKTLELTPLTGGGQHGMSFNRWGDRFVCSNSDHLQAIVFEERYLSRNPYQSVVSARRSIASDGPQAEVYRVSPVEAWREARTKLRVAGLAPGPIEGGGRAAGYFTGSTGVTVYEGGLWPNNDDATVLISDVGSNLVHRKRLVPDGVTYRGDRVDQNREFIRSKDIWFRPVQMAIGPEGALYVIDMYREVIEHPASLPAVIKQQLDLSSGEDRGRLYRVVPVDYQYSSPTLLSDASAENLVAALDDPNQWRRMTALRLIYQRGELAHATMLREFLPRAKRPEGRIAVLYALDSLSALEDEELRNALGDIHPHVRRHAIRLSEARLNRSAELRDRVLSLRNDDDLAIQFQLALSLGECQDTAITQALATILLRASTNQDIVDAVLTSIVDRAGPLLALIVDNEQWAASRTGENVLRAIVGQIARQRRAEDLDKVVALLRASQGPAHAPGAAALLKALSRLPADALKGDDPRLSELLELRKSSAGAIVRHAVNTLNDQNASPEARVAAIEDLTLGKFSEARPLLETLLAPQESSAIHAAVLAACGQFNSPDVAAFVLAHWPQFAPAERAQATEVLLRRTAWAQALVQFLATEDIRITTLDPAHVAKLENYPSPQVRDIVRKLRGQNVSDDRQKVFKEYVEILTTSGDSTHGKLVFEKNCASCHQLGGVGQAVGPNLAAMVSRGAESVLFNLLAPSVEVDPRYLEYVVMTGDGEVITGLIAGETSTAVTLRGPENKTTTVLRVDIDDMRSSGKSLMPEGFEKVIDKKSMADLLAYLKQSAEQGVGK